VNAEDNFLKSLNACLSPTVVTKIAELLFLTMEFVPIVPLMLFMEGLLARFRKP